MGVGNGYRMWDSSDNYKMHFGTGTEYKYGPVQSYAIKMNMYTANARGWVWGGPGSTPVAAIDVYGKMQIAGRFNVSASEIPPNNMGKNQTCAIRVNNEYVNEFGGMSEIQFGIGTTGKNMAAITASYRAHNGSPGGDLIFGTSPSTSDEVVERMRISHNGNVAIGHHLMADNYLFSVNGNMRARAIYVNADAWADYVFADDYELKPLSEVEHFIEKNNHLPGVPSEDVVIEEGVNLVEMDAILLQKIEELTLYMIDLKKENDELRGLIGNK
jgi:hypothetical protein